MILRYNLFTIIWAAMIMLTTLLPSTSMPSLSAWELFSFDSFAHFFVFAVLTFLMIVGLIKQYTYPRLRHYAIRSAFLICSMYGVLIEFIQHFLVYGRQGDVIDALADTIGCLVGIVLFKWVYIW
ncbi:VanZ family protein [Pontibacter harenae]|uniref:VanZ family protein n=1 Tax=Pontibacter harenae TaxID=2894083 RepID=UPI001E5ADA34|nr:VanZ family protein [Pontibacter harenae]MCC9166664.1 VanZ family protein [Pontibacter harenae]